MENRKETSVGFSLFKNVIKQCNKKTAEQIQGAVQKVTKITKMQKEVNLSAERDV